MCAGLHQCRIGGAERAAVDRAAEAQLRALVATRVDAAVGSRGIHNARLVLKRFDPAMASGRTPMQVTEAQVHRRRAIELATGWRGMHWGWDEAADADVFWKTLVAQGWKPRWRA